MSSTTYAKRNIYKPIDFFYRGIADTKTKKVVFVDAFQILNDRFLGRMSVCNYFFIAENSVRINELNVIALDELKNYHQVMRENFLIPDRVVYSLPITTRFLESEKEFEVLLASLRENCFKKKSLIITFNCHTIIRIDDEGKKRYDRLRRLGYLTCVNGFGEEFNSLDIFAKLNFNYLRVEAAYFDSSASKKKILNMLVKFCGANKIGLVMEGVDTPQQLNRFKREGVKMVTGKAVSKLSRWVTNEFLNLPPLTGEKKEAYLKKLKAELDAQERKEKAAEEKARLEKLEKAKSAAASGRVTPTAPRPQLMKSPYQVRLEQQKQSARRAAIARAERMALRAEEMRLSREESQEKRLIQEMSPSSNKFGRDLQSALSVTSVGYDKLKLKNVSSNQKNIFSIPQAQKDFNKDFKEEEDLPLFDFNKFAKKRTAVNLDEPVAEVNSKEHITTDTEREEDLLEEAEFNDFEELNSAEESNDAVNADETADDEEDETIVGHYNEKGQWVDENGYVYNGYFDDNGDWQDYETFNPEDEGSYNENGQWVDKEGNVYDGYFDDEGRWIDFTYINEEGNVVDNGYFDTKIGKWVPFGYFDENGIWRNYK